MAMKSKRALGLLLPVGLVVFFGVIYQASPRWFTPDSTYLITPTTKLDIGVIQFGSLAEGLFLLIPTGNHPLIIESIETDCGCLLLDWPQTPTAVGDTAFFKGEI